MSKNSPSIRIADLGAHAGQSVEVQGWVTHVRSSGKIAFVVIRDGSGIAQVVLVKSEVSTDIWERFGTLTQETCVRLIGLVREDKRSPGGYEIAASDLAVVGASPQEADARQGVAVDRRQLE